MQSFLKNNLSKTHYLVRINFLKHVYIKFSDFFLKTVSFSCLLHFFFWFFQTLSDFNDFVATLGDHLKSLYFDTKQIVSLTGCHVEQNKLILTYYNFSHSLDYGNHSS